MTKETNVGDLEIHGLMSVNVLIHNKNGVPAVELRSQTTDLNLIKTIISCAYRDIPIIIMPKFSDKLNSISSCVEKGILMRDNDQYFFTF